MTKEELKNENIKAGLISIVDTDKVEYKKQDTAQNGEESLSFNQNLKTQDVNEVTVPDVTKTKSGVVKANKQLNTISKSVLSLSGPSREEKGLEGIVMSTTTSKSLKQKPDGSYSFSSKSNTGTVSQINSNVKGIDSGNSSLGENNKISQTGNSQKTTIGVDSTNSGNSGNLGEIKVEGNGINSSIPKNISADVLDVAGAEVIWKKYVKPEYPDIAQQNGWTGVVAVEFVIKGTKTTYTGVVGKSGYAELDKAVDKVAKSWSLSIRKGGKSIDGRIKVKVRFSL